MQAHSSRRHGINVQLVDVAQLIGCKLMRSLPHSNAWGSQQPPWRNNRLGAHNNRPMRRHTALSDPCALCVHNELKAVCYIAGDRICRAS